jgi:hypothetical protein
VPALPERHSGRPLQLYDVVKTSFKAVIGNAKAEVMDMVEANIGGKPL